MGFELNPEYVRLAWEARPGIAAPDILSWSARSESPEALTPNDGAPAPSAVGAETRADETVTQRPRLPVVTLDHWNINQY